MKRLVGIFAALAISSAAPAAAPAPTSAALNAAAIAVKLPADIPWRDARGLPGSQQAVLAGDPAKPGLYVVMNKFQPGHFSMPHFHPNDRYITVLKGTWWVGTGTNFDPERNTVAMPAGSFVTHFAKQVHYDGAKTGEVVLLIVGQGPATGVQCTGAEKDGPCAAP